MTDHQAEPCISPVSIRAVRIIERVLPGHEDIVWEWRAGDVKGVFEMSQAATDDQIRREAQKMATEGIKNAHHQTWLKTRLKAKLSTEIYLND